MFSTIHTSIGVMFIGIAVIYIAKQATESKDSWMMEVVKQDKLIDAANTEGIWDDIVAGIETYGSKYKIIFFWLLWIAAGLIFGVVSVDDWDTSMALDFVLSSLSGGGYLSLPPGSSKWKYFFTALYTGIGMPITSISIGLIISFALISNDSNAYYEAVCSVITEKELEFMKIFGIDDGDGTIDNREFIILIAVRFGAASPGLLAQIKDRFEELDRERTGYIKYNDLIKGRRGRIVKKQFKKALSSSAFKMAALLQSSESFKSESLLANKKDMYTIKDSFNEADEVNDSDSDSEGGVENQVACLEPHQLGELLEPCLDLEDKQRKNSVEGEIGVVSVREFRASSLDADIESQIKVDPLGGQETNPADDNELPARNNRTTINSKGSGVGDSTSFYKVTKAAQMWKKKSSQENVEESKTQPTSNQIAPAPTADVDVEAPDHVIATEQKSSSESSNKRPNRRETYIQQGSDSIITSLQSSDEIKTFSPQWLVLKATNPMFLSILAW